MPHAHALRAGGLFDLLGSRPGVGCEPAFLGAFPSQCAVSPGHETLYFPPRVFTAAGAWRAVACPTEARRQAVADAVCHGLGHPAGASASATCSGLQLLPDGSACGVLPMAARVDGAWGAASAGGCQLSSVTCKPSPRVGEHCMPGFHGATHTTCRVVDGVVRVKHGVVKALYTDHQQHSCLHDGSSCICCDENNGLEAPPSPPPTPATAVPTTAPPTPVPSPGEPCVAFGDGSLRSGTFFDEGCVLGASAASAAFSPDKCSYVGATCYAHDAVPATQCGGGSTAGACKVICKDGFWRTISNTCNNRAADGRISADGDTCAATNAQATNYDLGCCTPFDSAKNACGNMATLASASTSDEV